MGLLNLLTGDGMQTAALGFLKDYMKKGGVKLATIEFRTDANGKEVFDPRFFTEDMAIIKQTDLSLYQSAVNKCIEHGIEF